MADLIQLYCALYEAESNTAGVKKAMRKFPEGWKTCDA